jgi:hypothetical protein
MNRKIQVDFFTDHPLNHTQTKLQMLLQTKLVSTELDLRLLFSYYLFC